MTSCIDIRNKDQVAKISELASQTPYAVWLSAGNVTLDARSLLGLFALIGKRARVVAGDGADPEDFERLVQQMA